MFTYKVSKNILTEGIEVKIEGELGERKHTFITILGYDENIKENYNTFVSEMVNGLEEKLKLMEYQDIY
tara:strand:- start:15757 stop:15963 length:207 start_codon:yes stop_codon:yes gene_type:complete